MAISAKNLNEHNSGYGYKQFQHSWTDAMLPLLRSIFQYYENGGYDRVLQRGKELFNSRVGKLSDLPKMHEADLAIVYLMGKSYLAFGQIDNAIGCFHLVYSQHGFEKQMLTGPYDFRGFVEKAKSELENLARDRGEDYVNNFQVEPFFERELAKSGCFIATATYESPNASEVLLLRKFRDEVLLTSTIGKRAVGVYYFASPPLASLVSRVKMIRALARLTLWPIVKLLKS